MKGLQPSEQPPPEAVLSESKATKVLWGQWHTLTLRNGVLYRELSGLYGRPPMVQLVVLQVERMEFVKRCHEGMTGGHRAFRSTLEQVRRRGFWFGWRRDIQRLPTVSKVYKLPSRESVSIRTAATLVHWQYYGALPCRYHRSSSENC